MLSAMPINSLSCKVLREGDTEQARLCPRLFRCPTSLLPLDLPRFWASEQTSFPHETCEHALAHRISDKAEAAYRRGDQLDKRRKLLEAWAAFCEPKIVGKGVPMKPKP